ncbi:hypothetical protein K8R47_01130 [archaeon]|nr:hypothetical protein [archaeon]
MNKKGDFGFNYIAKILLVIVVLVILILITYLFKDKLLDLVDSLTNIMR